MTRRTPARPRTRRRPRDRGSASLEFLGILPVLLLVALAAVQLGLAAYAVQQAGTAARAAARTAAMDPTDQETDPQTAGRAAISDWVARRASISVGGSGDAVSATATVPIPSILPGADFGSARRSATMPRPEGAPGAPARPPRTDGEAPPR
ncbi:TadE/TadG family type IV pilus assembly protein [Streptomyces sp. NPDC001793]|uniref:TadE/TadG family type IV pilus assembly protein n=1 Tax=Streptomyces sp. NPDC001793 TaxID=3154657 RepID=UPI00332696EA